MNSLSVRGVMRKFSNTTGSINLKAILFPGIPVPSRISLRAILEGLCRVEHSFDVSECVYGWTAAFTQTWAQVDVGVKLEWDATISNATRNSLLQSWEAEIKNTWATDGAVRIPANSHAH